MSTRTDIPQPPLDARTPREFHAALMELREACGAPSYKDINAGASDAGQQAIARSTLSNLVTARYPKIPPRLSLVRSFVAGCLISAGRSVEAATAEIEGWERAWLHLVSAMGESPGEPVGPAVGEIVGGAEPVPSVDLVAPEDRSTGIPVPRPRSWSPALRAGLIALALATSFVAGTFVDLWGRPTGEPAAARTPPGYELGRCAEGLKPDPGTRSLSLGREPGPPGSPRPDRWIETRTQSHPEHGWIVWGRLTESASAMDRLWLDWTYVEDPQDQAEWRQCGVQPIAEGRDTPAALARDDGRKRWFRACGQAPPEDRTPGRSGVFCTSWVRPGVT
ncbi:hypothetical protein [Streptomyces sp. NPDC058665]|uniref:hypothetical protein n=1 Tax=Streptomyces sp. NPDC058665 TaxID=3346586 RepID=UPI00365F1C6F